MRLKHWLGGGSLCAAAVLLSLPASAQEAQVDIKPDHWAYSAVQDLAKKGLIKGYPPDGNFLGARTLTRYEMATIVKRVLDRMDEIVRTSGASGAQAEELKRLRASRDDIRRLAEEFRVQLVVIGSDLSQVRNDLKALSAQSAAIGARVDGLDRRAGALAARVDETTVRTDQALKGIGELREATNSAIAGLGKKVDVGTGRLRISGLLQVWYGSAFGDSLGGNNPTNFSPVPQGRNFGGGVGDTFRLRRGNIALDGQITSRVDYHAMFDVAKTRGAADGSILQDLVVGYQLTPELRLEIGQQKTGLSEEGTRDDSQLYTIARSIMNEDLPANAGRIGNARDTGAVLRLRTSRIKGFVGIWNDNGATQNAVDNNRLKFLDGGLYISTLRHFTFGVWGGTNVGSYRPAEQRDRAGFTLLFDGGPHYFEIEGAYARDIVAGGKDPALSGAIAVGFYALYVYRVSKKWQVLIRYDVWDPAQHDTGATLTASGVLVPQANHKLKEYTFGINYNINALGTKIQLNYIRDDVEQNGSVFFGVPRSVLLANYQVGF